MKILFDQGVPVPLRRELPGHDIKTAYEHEWSTLRNGELIAAAEQEGYDLLITTDQNLKYQQNLTARKISIVVLLSTSWPKIQKCSESVRASTGRAGTGSYEEIPIP